MKISWLDELNFLAASGGGERYKQHLHRFLTNNGHEISCFTPNYYIGDLSSDLFIISDPYNRPNLQPRQWFNESLLQNIITSHKYITFDTGWSTLCFVDYFPCNGTYKGCPDCSVSGKRIQWLQEYYSRAVANIFLSPLHKQITETAIKCKLDNSVLLGPSIDITTFCIRDVPQDIDIIYSGVFHQAKGCHYLINMYGNTDNRVVIVGDNLWPWKLPKNFELIGKLSDPKEIAYLYNRSKYFWGYCSWPEAFGLSSVEAILCGCSIITDTNTSLLGSFSWNVDWRDPKNVLRNNHKCWQNILEKLNVKSDYTINNFTVTSTASKD